MQNSKNEWKKKIQRPIGIYVATAIVLIKFGILNLIGYYLSIKQGTGDVPFLIVSISIGLSFFTIAAAIWAFIGDNEGRISLLIILPLNILWFVLIGLQALFDSSIENDKDAVVIIVQQVALSLVVIGIEWYFMSKQVVRYYKQND